MLSDEEREALEILNNTEWEGFMITIKNLIEKQSKEIEELKEKNRQGKIRIVQLENEITARIEDVNKYFTPNDKIKAKIEEVDIQLQKLKDGLTGRKTNFVNKNMLFAQKKALQSLLEKE